VSQNPAVKQPIPVGEYFLERGKISEKQLELALKHRAEFNLKLGQSLVELGFVTEADMVEALRHQARFPCVHLTSGIIDLHVARKLSEEISRRLRAVALNQIAGHTTVALDDPSDVKALEELAHILATRIFPVYAEHSAILRNLELIFGPERGGRARAAASPTQPQPRAAPRATPPAAKPAPLALEENANARPAEPPADEVPAERAVVERLRATLQEAFVQGVSAIHLEARSDGLAVRFRVDGVLREHARLPAGWARQTVACLKSLAKLEDEDGTPVREGTIPFAFKGEALELRVALTPSLHGESLVLRVLRGARPPRALHDLGLEVVHLAQLEEALSTRGGLYLVAGPARSGRTTTLHALLAHLASSERKAVALEERATHEHAHVLQVELDRAGAGYAAGARALLRQDPDLMLVGELTGRETAHVLFDAAQSGKGVLTTLRAGGALETLAALRAFGLEPYLLADTLRGVVAQRLVRRICAGCRAPIVPDEALRTRLGIQKDGASYFEGQGCDACRGSGYRDQLALFEVLTMTPGLRHALETGCESEGLAHAARASAFTTLREHGLRQARLGLTTLHEVLAATVRG
jgi:type IV pilus assembly protein PilB